MFSEVNVPLCIQQVKAATGEEVSAEDLGGADLHCRLEEHLYAHINTCFELDGTNIIFNIRLLSESRV